MQPLRNHILAYAFAIGLAIVAMLAGVNADTIGGCCKTASCTQCTSVSGGEGKNPTGSCNSFSPSAHVVAQCAASDCSEGCVPPSSQTCLTEINGPIRCVVIGA